MISFKRSSGSNGEMVLKRALILFHLTPNLPGLGRETRLVQRDIIIIITIEPLPYVLRVSLRKCDEPGMRCCFVCVCLRSCVCASVYVFLGRCLTIDQTYTYTLNFHKLLNFESANQTIQ